MINRLTYEVRLRKNRVKGARWQEWRWDVIYNKTTDPEHAGVETGRQEIGSQWGYTKTKWQAVRKIVKAIESNNFKGTYPER